MKQMSKMIMESKRQYNWINIHWRNWHNPKCKFNIQECESRHNTKRHPVMKGSMIRVRATGVKAAGWLTAHMTACAVISLQRLMGE